jgi:drug/metabolite transporter (DMT)-like permease
MTDQAKIQLAGLMLAVTTAAGCLAYERLVKNLHYVTVGFLSSVAFMPFWVTAYLIKVPSIRSDLSKLNEHKLAVAVFCLSGCTSLFWYFVTRNRSVMVGALFEIKYIVVLALFYIFFGVGRMTWNVLAGSILAALSVYLISKPN